MTIPTQLPPLTKFPSYEKYMSDTFKRRSTAQIIQWGLRTRLGNLSRLRWHLEQQARISGSKLRREIYAKALEAVDLDIADARLAMTKLPSKWKIRALEYVEGIAEGGPARGTFRGATPSGGGISPPDLSRSDQLG